MEDLFPVSFSGWEPMKSDKNYAVAVILSTIFGVFGIQHFYLGRWFLGLFDLSLSICAIYHFAIGKPGLAALFAATDFIHTTIVTIELFTGKFKDGQGRIVCYPGQKLEGLEDE